ncbi:MAG: zinc ribbon domain-containing protein [Candidatus Aminicenantes bacterium]|nr:zinc ribbon domain-containing protein [Candidatus Aminicenantes bacterium]
MNASTAKTLGIILVVLIVISAAWPLKYVLFAPAGFFHGLSNGWHNLRADGDWVWPWIGFAGFFGLLLLAFWIAIVVWVYKDAEKRGMNAIVWALVAFFVHFVGVIIYLLVRSEHPIRARDSAQAGPTTVQPPAPAAPPRCPKCGQTTDTRHTFCPACGERIKPVCPACGKDVQAGWKACPNCGGSL